MSQNGASSEEPDFMKIAIDEACRGLQNGEGGPFGAVVTRQGKIIARGHNRVLQTNDPTAHAEVVAIRDACASLGRFSLHDCVIYSSCKPCPMCFASIHWAKIPRCVYSGSTEDAASAGFDDQFLYQAIRGTAKETKCLFEEARHTTNDKPFKLYSQLLENNESGTY